MGHEIRFMPLHVCLQAGLVHDHFIEDRTRLGTVQSDVYIVKSRIVRRNYTQFRAVFLRQQSCAIVRAGWFTF